MPVHKGVSCMYMCVCMTGSCSNTLTFDPWRTKLTLSAPVPLTDTSHLVLSLGFPKQPPPRSASFSFLCWPTPPKSSVLFWGHWGVQKAWRGRGVRCRERVHTEALSPYVSITDPDMDCLAPLYCTRGCLPAARGAVLQVLPDRTGRRFFPQVPWLQWYVLS